MLIRTSLSAIRSLVYIERSGQSPVSPKQIAAALGESPSYLAKVLRQLVKAGILRASKGARGGVSLARPSSRISLLSIVEACQGVILGDFCRDVRPLRNTCAYHQAMAQLHGAIVEALSEWTLAQLAEHPGPRLCGPEPSACLVRWPVAGPSNGRRSSTGAKGPRRAIINDMEGGPYGRGSLE